MKRLSIDLLKQTEAHQDNVAPRDGPSDDPRDMGFRPAFFDYATGLIYLSRYRDGREAGTAGLLLAALREHGGKAAAESLYVWASCEFADFREIRKIVRKEWASPRDRHFITAYWRRGAQGDDEGGDE